MSPRLLVSALSVGWMALATAFAPTSAHAQVELRDLVVTAGVGGEGYRGNLPSVTLPIIDNANSVSAFVGELGVRAIGMAFVGERGRFDASFDGGLRQFAAAGFELRDYAPREWVGTLRVDYSHSVGQQSLVSVGSFYQGRHITDRPPMPLFLQPGFGIFGGEVAYARRFSDPVTIQFSVTGERANYESRVDLPQLNLLDRDSFGARVTGTIGQEVRNVRIWAAMQWSEYPRQGSFDPSDPLRRDRAFQAGFLSSFRIFGNRANLEAGVEGILNRSNSSRPEYDAIKVVTQIQAPFVWETSLNFYAELTGKSYLEETEFARLVPGEEADNASVAYLEFARPIAANLDGALRLGWTRAEADIGDSYFQRFGGFFLFRYRPGT